MARNELTNVFLACGWVAETEGAKFWLSILTGLKNRRGKDILIACVNGMKGVSKAIEAAFPRPEGCFALSTWGVPLELCILKQCKEMAGQADRPVLSLSSSDPQGHLHDQRHQVTQYIVAEGYQ